MHGIWAAWTSTLQSVPKSIKITAKETCAFGTDAAFVSVPEFFDICDPIAIDNQRHYSTFGSHRDDIPRESKMLSHIPSI